MKTYKDVYTLPLKMLDKDYYSRVYDSNNNVVFQFTFYGKYQVAKNMLDTINGQGVITSKTLVFSHSEGMIKVKERTNTLESNIILIRGWGNLTGKGGMNLSFEEAINIQNTFAEFIVKQLNNKT